MKKLLGGAGLLGCTGIGLVGALVVVLAIGAVVRGQYNELVTLDEAVDTGWSQVENVYQRRADLIPNLVETVKGAADFERETFEAVAKARSRAGQMSFDSAPSPEQLLQFQAAQGELSQALSRLMVVVERYPELRATEAFRDLQAQLEGTENRISVERGRYNQTAQSYNTYRRRFPTNIVAGFFDFGEKAYFKAREGADVAPTVDFN